MSKRRRRRRSSPEIYAKDVLGTILEFYGQVIMEQELVERRLRADMLFVPRPGRQYNEDLGVIMRIIELGPCIIELFSRPPGAQAGMDCMSKHLAHHGEMRNHARRNQESTPERPRLWMITPGRPRSLIAAMGLKPMQGWPTGFWSMDGEFHVHLIVVRELPATPDTLLLRLLDHGKRRERALAELDALKHDSLLRWRLAQVALAHEPPMDDTFEGNDMMSPETRARYEKWESKTIAKGIALGIEQGIEQGIEKGIEQGIEKGVAKGERGLVRKLLTLRFGALPANVEQRLEHASLAELELWAERVLTADSLAAVLAD